MRIYFISPIGKKSYLLFDTFIPIFESNGHIIVNDVKDADIVFFDMYDRKCEYEQSDLDNSLTLPKVVFDFWDYGGCEDGTHIFPYWGDNIQITGFLALFETVNIWFVRKLDKSIKLTNVYPIECCLYPDHDFEPTTNEEFNNRPYDIFFAGNESPTRKNVINGLLNSAQFKMDVHWSGENGKLPHDEWLNRARQAKMFLSADGGGFSDERSYQLITIAAFLKNKNNHFQLNPFNNFNECLEVSEYPTENEIYNIKQFISSKHNLYHIYEQGIWHMKKYYSFEYRANYILDTIQKNIYL